MRRRAKSNRRRVTFVGDASIVTRRVPAAELDPLLADHERQHQPIASRSELLAAMQDADDRTVPVCPTGRCHTCDRRISGERIYCGPCAAKRDTRR